MYPGLLLFALGVSMISALPVLPYVSALWLLALGSCLAFLSPITRPLIGLLAGLAVASYSGHQWLSNVLPIEWEKAPLLLEVKILDIPQARATGYRLRAKVVGSTFTDRNLLVSWYTDTPPQVGERWLLDCRLFRPRGTVNTGLFDYSAWLLSQRIHAVGYVAERGQSHRMQSASGWRMHHRWRELLSRNLMQQQLNAAERGMLTALVLGQSNELSTKTWDVLSKTGTNHLFVVSGLHVGMVMAGLLFLLRRLHVRLSWSVFMSITGLGLYCLIVGFGLPVQRAFVMSVAGLLFLFSRREIAFWRVFVIALAIVLLVNPFAVLAAGFWLSFGAVGGLIVAFSGWQNRSVSLAYGLARTQLVALAATAPLLLYWVGMFSFVSVLANLIAVPVMGVVIVPLIFAYIVAVSLDFTFLTPSLILVLTQCLSWLLDLLGALAKPNFTFTQVLPVGLAMVFAVLGGLILMLPAGWIPRWLCVFLFVPLLTLTDVDSQSKLISNPVAEYLRVDVLDVGQGLSVLITGPSSTVVYDTGPTFSRLDSGKTVVLPTLSRLGRNKIDLLVVSHGDSDHAGGARSLTANLPVQRAVSSRVEYGQSCADGNIQLADMTIEWTSATFLDSSTNSNDASCVVRIENRYGSVLLPGDISRSAEAALLHKLKPTDLLLSPHHGSRSSSSPSFVNQTGAKWVVHSTGYQNRFNHPHDEVQMRYENRGIRQYNTAQTGALTFVFSPNGVAISSARSFQPRFWYDPRLSRSFDDVATTDGNRIGEGTF